MLERGYTIDITTADASRPEDKCTILNTIAGVPPERLRMQEPDLSCPEFQKVNVRLRGMFAEAAANKAAKQDRLTLALGCLENDTEREALLLDFRGCEELQAFSQWEALGQLRALRHLKLDDARGLTALPKGSLPSPFTPL